jgi:sterol desaturase/sphingolipid hydroxylase (fatty acid hydroxylase superfamily)
MKKVVFTLFQPASVALIVWLWSLAPASLADNPWADIVAGLATVSIIQALEFINERHATWRLNLREFLTDAFYVALGYAVINRVATKLFDDPLTAAKGVLGISTPWALHLPFVAQVAIAFVVFEFGQYWMHRLMHNSFLWWTHAPHHHVTQLNAMKGFVGNPLELLLISIGATSLFDLKPTAVLCAFNVLGAVSAFAHANVRFDPPRWYAYVFTTIEHHSLHHQVGFIETRCNYANCFILLDRMFGTFRAGEAAVVGQDERKRLSIREQFMFPLRPLKAAVEARTA